MKYILSQSNSEDVEFNNPIPEDIVKVESLINTDPIYRTYKKGVII